VKPNDTLWRSDGTKSGTFKVTNLFGCNVNEGPPCAKSFTSVGGTLFFVAPRYEFQGPDYVHVATEVWKSNGTSAGTSLVKAFAPYAPWYAPGSCASYFCANFMVGASAAINGIYYFIGPEGDLWQSDGTGPGTTRACPDVEPCAGFMPSKFIVASGALYVTADAEGTGREVWRFIP
jgi:ELWxxDGT repeat protein